MDSKRTICFLFWGKGLFKNLSKLSCRSYLHPEFFSQLYQVCHNIQSLRIEFTIDIPNELKDLISVQKNLKHLYLKQYVRSIEIDLESVIPLLTKHSDSLIKLEIDDFYKPLSFI